jgi:hypothetical protein
MIDFQAAWAGDSYNHTGKCGMTDHQPVPFFLFLSNPGHPSLSPQNGENSATANPSQIFPGKQPFYLGPPNGKIRLAVRQTPSTMHTVRQQAGRFRDDGKALLGFYPNGMK